MIKFTTVSKKMLAVFMAMLMLLSCMAVCASAAVSVPVPTYKLNEQKTAITVDPIYVEGSKAIITINPSTGIETLELADGSTRFDGISTGKTYTIIATVVTANGTGSNTVSVSVKKSQAAPSSPVAKSITTNTITIIAMAGCEYAYMRADDESTLSAYSENVIFSGLDAGTKYTIFARKKETNDSYAGATSSVTVTTLEKAVGVAPDKPVLVDKTNKTITVKEIKDVEFSIDGGKTWQTSGEFKDLSAGKLYGIVARYVFDETVQEAGAQSDPLQVKTNSRESYKASIGSCTFKAEDGKRYSNEELEILVTGDAPADLVNPQFGDTRYTPSYYMVDTSARKLGFTSSDGKIFKGLFTPDNLGDGSKANKTIFIVVTYSISRYDGAKWVTLEGKEESATYEVELGPKRTFFTGIVEALEKLLNVLLNDIPGAIAGFFNGEQFGEIWEGLLGLGNLVGGLGGATGGTTGGTTDTGSLDIGALLGSLTGGTTTTAK